MCAMHLNIISHGMLELAHACSESWLLNFQEFCKPVDIMLLAWNRPWWEYLNHRNWKILKIRLPSSPWAIVKHLLAYPLVIHIDSPYILVFLFSVFLTTFIIDLIFLQYKFNKQWEVCWSWRGKGKGHQKLLISSVRFLSQFISVHFSSTDIYWAPVTLIARHPGYKEK